MPCIIVFVKEMLDRYGGNATVVVEFLNDVTDPNENNKPVAMLKTNGDKIAFCGTSRK